MQLPRWIWCRSADVSNSEGSKDVNAVWKPRDSSMALLAGPLQTDRLLIEELLLTISSIVDQLGKVDSPKARVVALLLLKARRYGLAIYTLSLDCLGQEAGVFMRLLQEAWELLIYLRMDS